MEIQKPTFRGSWEKSDGMGYNALAEFAFIGRSNVGKSSLINMLCNHKGLAKISATPGKTQTINIFDIDGKWQICDLPGYGYAKVSKQKRFTFSNMIKYYLNKRENLVCLFILVDLRLPPQSIDLDFINWCGENGIPFVIIGTKADKAGKNNSIENVKVYKEKLSEIWDELPRFIISSSEDKTGRKEILDFIQECMGK